jgi:hypothetical protein
MVDSAAPVEAAIPVAGGMPALDPAMAVAAVHPPNVQPPQLA